jgi:hypothetical protein
MVHHAVAGGAAHDAAHLSGDGHSAGGRGNPPMSGENPDPIHDLAHDLSFDARRTALVGIDLQKGIAAVFAEKKGKEFITPLA